MRVRMPVIVAVPMIVMVIMMRVPVIMVAVITMRMMMMAVIVMMMSMPIMPMLVMRMMMQPLARPGPAGVLAEDERLDGDRHRVRGQPDAAEVDVVEVHQHQPVDDEDVAFDAEVLAHDGA